MIGNPRCPICGLYELNDGSEETLYTCECDAMDSDDVSLEQMREDEREAERMDQAMNDGIYDDP